MARIHDLLRSVATTNEGLADEIRREIDATYGRRRAFGLNFERHTPEAVELPGRAVRKGDKVHVLPPRGETVKAENKVMWFVESVDRKANPATATIVREANESETESRSVEVDDLVVVAEFRDPIYPGLVSTGKVERGGDKPYHSVINAENFHALQALMFTHRGKVDAIYIDPPYNTGAKDWKYNNDYVESDDAYRHSKWLAFMERRLLIAKELLNPENSVLIVTIDEKEYLRLGLLLDQVFPEVRSQRITSVINQSGAARLKEFARVDESIFILFFGDAGPSNWEHNMLQTERIEKAPGTIWRSLLRAGTDARRADSPNLFYPVWVEKSNSRIHSVGDSVPKFIEREAVEPPSAGLVAIWPLRSDKSEGRWQLGPAKLRERLSAGTAKLGSFNKQTQTWAINYLREAELARLERGELVVTGRDENGALMLEWGDRQGAGSFAPASVWNVASHNAGNYGSTLLRALIPSRVFPFPKSLFAVEDCLRFFVSGNKDAKVVDFFSGSGTTAHAVMRLNKQDGGRRISISVTNNEVSADEQKDLRAARLRPGDPEWEKWGICDYITKPRIEAAITGKTPDGEPVQGDYKFTDEFPMAEGFEENVEFFTLTYESQLAVSQGLAFERIAPLLWIRAGQIGRRIESLTNGFDVSDSYGVISDLDKTDQFVSEVTAGEGVGVAFVITEEDRLFETVAQALPAHVEVVRLYDDYFRNFEVDALAVDR